MTVDEQTIAFYEGHPEDYFSATVSSDLSGVYRRFLTYIPRGGFILDAGCGVGRDSSYFVSQGYDVTAFDPSPAMAVRCRDYAGVPVSIDSFSSFKSNRTFDGIWACASLLHMPADELPVTLKRLVSFLKPEGIIFASFRYGQGSHRDTDGRFFTDMDETQAKCVVSDVKDLELVELWCSTARNAAGTTLKWLNLIARRAKGA